MDATPVQLLISSTETLVKLGSRESYRIRIVPLPGTSGEQYAIGAMRCEHPRHVELLSEPVRTPLEAARIMYDGFDVRGGASERACQILSEMLKSGLARRVAERRVA